LCTGDLAFIILVIEKFEGKGQEKVCFKESMTAAECEAAVSNGEFKKAKEGTKDEEPATWCVFRHKLITYPSAYGACFVDYTSKDGRPGCSKLGFMIWHDATRAKVSSNMKYSSTPIKNKFGNVTPKPLGTADEPGELAYSEILPKVQT